jgi:hypothetical protein
MSDRCSGMEAYILEPVSKETGSKSGYCVFSIRLCGWRGFAVFAPIRTEPAAKTHCI